MIFCFIALVLAINKRDLSTDIVRINETCSKSAHLDLKAIAVLRSIRVAHHTSPLPRIFCIINTMEAYHSTRAQAVKHTWARNCDGYTFISNVTDRLRPSVALNFSGDESHENLWQKTRAMGVWLQKQTIFKDYDWFLRADDDAFVIMDNLRYYLRSAEITRFQPRYHRLVLGHVFDQPHKNSWFVAGSAFVLSHAAAEAFAIAVQSGKCNPDARSSADDVEICVCLKKEYDVIPLDTRDTYGRHRFHMLSADGSATVHNWDAAKSWIHNMHSYVRSGLDCCSDMSISFHYVNPQQMLEYERLLYTCRLD